MSITMNSSAGRKGKRVNLKNTPQHSRPSSSLARSRASHSHRAKLSDASSSDLTPAEDDDETEDECHAGYHDDDETDDDDQVVYPTVIQRKGKKRESDPRPQAPIKDKGKGKALAPLRKTAHDRATTPRPSAIGPNGRERKRKLKLGEVARRRARDDKFGFGGDRFGNITPTQARSLSNPVDSDTTSSFGDDESEPENAPSVHGSTPLDAAAAAGDETEDDEVMGGLPEAFAGQEIEDLAYGAGYPSSSLDGDEGGWWQEEDEDEDFIATLTGSDIDNLESQSSVHNSNSDDPMSDDSDTSDTDGALDEFGFPAPFGASVASSSDAPLILMENWDGQFVLVQPRHDRQRSRRSERGSRTAGSVGESTSVSAGEQQLVIDADADDSDCSTDWSGIDDDHDDGGDTTDSMAEEDMPVLDSPALDEIIGQQLAPVGSAIGYGGLMPTLASVLDFDAGCADMHPPAILVTDPCVETPAPSLSVGSAVSAPTPVVTTPTQALQPSALPSSPLPATVSSSFSAVLAAAALPPAVLPPTPLSSTFPTTLPATLPTTGLPIPSLSPALAAPPLPTPAVPVMGTFIVKDAPCAHAVIDGSKTTTKSPFARRRRPKQHSVETSSITSTKRRTGLDPFSPMRTKTRYSSIPGHPRYLAARRAAQSLVDDRETTPPTEEDEPAFSLEDMLDASVLHMNDGSVSGAPGGGGMGGVGGPSAANPADAHLFRFDKVSVSTYMRRNFQSRGRQNTPTPQNNTYMSYPSPRAGSTGPSALTDTLAAPLPPGASRMLISPILPPVDDEMGLGRKNRKGRKLGLPEMHTLQI